MPTTFSLPVALLALTCAACAGSAAATGTAARAGAPHQVAGVAVAHTNGPTVSTTRLTSAAIATTTSAPSSHAVTIFAPEAPCGEPTPRTIALAAASPEQAVRAVVESTDHAGALPGVALAPPNVVVEAETARVDLRASGGGSLKDLPPCATVALLASIRRTLTSDGRWNVARVIFTEKGDLLAAG